MAAAGIEVDGSEEYDMTRKNHTGRQACKAQALCFTIGFGFCMVFRSNKTTTLPTFQA